MWSFTKTNYWSCTKNSANFSNNKRLVVNVNLLILNKNLRKIKVAAIFKSNT